MKPPDEVRKELVHQWIAKAELDFELAVHLLGQDGRFREVIAFHAQQAAEKYLKALLVQHQIPFPKTHDVGRLLDLLATTDPLAVASLREVDALTPFGVETRYPSDSPELLPGEEQVAVDLARRTREFVLTRV